MKDTPTRWIVVAHDAQTGAPMFEDYPEDVARNNPGDAVISGALRALELDPTALVFVPAHGGGAYFERRTVQ
jgi:hypothetical protein